MSREIVDLQLRCDDHFLGKINKQNALMEKHADQLHHLSNMILHLQDKVKKAENVDKIPFSEIKNKVADFKEVWDEIRTEWPVVEECPFDPHMDLEYINKDEIDTLERKIDAARARLQNFSTDMLPLEVATQLHKLFTEILMYIVKERMSSVKRIINNQLTR